LGKFFGILGKHLNAFYFCNIYNVNYNPIDYIIYCAVREHPDRKPASVIIPNFMAFPVQGVEDLRRCPEKVKPGNFRRDVAGRSSGIRLNEIKDPRREKSKASDMKAAVQEVKSSQSAGLSLVETYGLLCWGVLKINSLGISFVSPCVQ
jgi:hypothetical protein